MTPAAARSIVAIDGIDGSGKSVLAARLAAAARDAGIPTVVLAVDDFRRPVDWGASRFSGSGGDRSEADVYYDDYYDLPMLDRCLVEFRAGAAASGEIPIFDATANRLAGRRTLTFADASVAIVEGVFSLRVAAVAEDAALIYVRTTFAAAERRILARDTARGRDPTDVNHRINARYFPSQRRYFRELDPLARADVLIDHETLGHLQVARFRTTRLGPTLTAALVRACEGFATPPALG